MPSWPGRLLSFPPSCESDFLILKNGIIVLDGSGCLGLREDFLCRRRLVVPYTMGGGGALNPQDARRFDEGHLAVPQTKDKQKQNQEKEEKIEYCCLYCNDSPDRAGPVCDVCGRKTTPYRKC